ncbi:uncharacterized protein DNG_07898 [Cephalotrichum gorgonifer]|uniref:BTB domain-containing protein n=1 Tax=Cephalotrichum gorgonifer TaxID=2041049 RepID=A0AAE8N2I1_9PEZI|nr:uncharacterized protein DNG_07898 [Cephalotrichum gorgonifer]
MAVDTSVLRAPSPPQLRGGLSNPPSAVSILGHDARVNTASPSTTPDTPLPSSGTDQAPDADTQAAKDEEGEEEEGQEEEEKGDQEEAQRYYSPEPSRPGSPMSTDGDMPETSRLKDVAKNEEDDLSHLGKLDLRDYHSQGVSHIWQANLPSDEIPQPDSHFPSTNPWPSANFTEVKSKIQWDRLEPNGFPLPSGRPTPVTTPAAIPDHYRFSSLPPPTTLSESSSLGVVYPRRYLGDIVTLGVGPGDDQFHVHKDMLTRSSVVFANMFGSDVREASEGKVTLDEDDPNAWALIIDWLYRGKLPPFKPVWALDMASAVTANSRVSKRMKRIPLPSYFGPPVSTYGTPGDGGRVFLMRLAHICTQPFYETMSADELRLIERHMDDGEYAAKYFYYLQSGRDLVWSGEEAKDGPPRQDATKSPLLTEQQHKDMYHHLITKEGIPVPVPFPGFIEAEFLQVTLVKVMILAYKYVFDDLFNDAMDLYRSGEREMERRHPVIRHIELAYAFCPRGCPLVTLMADMAAFSSKLNTMAPEILEFAAQCPEFGGDLATRHDRRVAFPGFDRRRDMLNMFQSPLGGGREYHIGSGAAGGGGGLREDVMARKSRLAGMLKDAQR